MDLGIAGRTALVLGAGGGLGGAVANALAAEGVCVAVAGRNRDRAAEAANSIACKGGQSLALSWDLQDLDAIEVNIGRLEEEWGHVDILVNNTGGPPPGSIIGHDLQTWRTQVDAMVLSVIALTDRLLPSMRDAKWGRVITSTSSGVVAPIPQLGLSNSLRSTLVAWSKTLANEVGGEGITANIVVPGRIDTKRVAALDESRAARESVPVDNVRQRSLAAIPAGRYGAPEEYAAVVAFLASEQASYVNGTVVRIDGGMIASI
ncbi:SDR family oxidoreductase [soil metagenome]